MGVDEPVQLGWQEKQLVLAQHFDRHGPFRFVIETGVYNGQGSCFQFEGRAEVVAVELDDVSASRARADGHDVRTGSSVTLLPWLLATRNAPALFWLDAHAVTDDGAHEYPCPLLEELAAIVRWPHAAESVVLIDDVRLMGSPGWPSFDEVFQAGFAIWNYCSISDDIMRLTP